MTEDAVLSQPNDTPMESEPIQADEADAQSGVFSTCQAAVIYEWRIPKDKLPPEWQDGPCPFTDGKVVASRDNRLRHFAEHTRTALYGDPNNPRRWHRFAQPSQPPGLPFQVAAVELLRLDSTVSETNGLAVVHGQLCSSAVVDTLSELARAPRRHESWLVDEVVGLGTPAAPEGQRGTTVVFARPLRAQLTPGLTRDGPSDWPIEMQWLWLLASATPEDRYPPHRDELRDLERHSFALSADWKALVLRDGVAFLGLQPDDQWQDFVASAALYVKSLYLDAILLGVAQRLLLTEILNAVSALDDPLKSPDAFRKIEHRVTKFRNVYWWQVVTTSGHANRLLELYADQNRLPAMAQHALQETTRFSEQIETRAAQESNAALGFLTLVGLPVGAAIGMAPLMPWEPTWVCLIVLLAVFSLASWGFSFTRLGRELRRPLRLGRDSSPQEEP